MTRELRSIRWLQGALLFGVLATGTQVACGEGTPAPDGGSGGSSGSGGQASSGGSTTSSGGAMSSSGGQDSASGGLGGAAPSGPCDDPALAPPCNDDDLHGGWLECKRFTTIEFTFPLSDVRAPAEGLRLVFLPLDSSLGVGGMGGANALVGESLDLREYAFDPLLAGETDDEAFNLLEPAISVGAKLDVSDGIPEDYVETHELGQYPWVWGRAHVALVQGETILLEHRLLINGTSVCLI